MELRGDEEEEFFKLLRIPCGRFVPPFLAAHQKEVAPQEFISKLLSLYSDAGFEFKKTTGERPDQIGVILEFLAILKSDGREPPADLIRLITCPIKQFAEALGKATDHPLFKKVAVALAELFESETVKIS
ncbi:MAG: molecular chaperone TorD family protein [Candidatus Aminicenantales bacterium]